MSAFGRSIWIIEDLNVDGELSIEGRGGGHCFNHPTRVSDEFVMSYTWWFWTTEIAC